MIHRRVLALLLIAICATLPALAIANKVGDASVANEPEPSSWGVSNVIEHIIVLMMENRSFDHLLGWLHEDYNSALEGLTPAFKQPRDPKDPSKGFLPVTRGGYDVGPGSYIY
jgi:phospholipase C